jgi:MoxR-like ATPase
MAGVDHAVEKLRAVRRELRDTFVERDELIDGALAALLCRQHVLVLGPPGTAKSLLAREVCRRVGGGVYFQWLLTKFTTPEEIFGPISLAALEAGRYERVTTGKLPVAHVAFLDEIFKANSAILNALLAVLNERQFHDGTSVADVPLQTLFAASNELPEEDELAALYDRFLLRYTVGYIEQDFRFARLLALDESARADATVLGPADVAELQRLASAVVVPQSVLRDLIEIRRGLSAEGVVASDRRYKQAVDVLRAAALLAGRERVGSGDLEWLVHVLWSDPEEKPRVRAVVGRITGGSFEEAHKLLFQAEEVYAYAVRPWPDELSRNRALLEAHTKLDDIAGRVDAMARRAAERDLDTAALDDVVERLRGLRRRLVGGERGE